MNTLLFKKHATGRIGTWEIYLSPNNVLVMETKVTPNATATVAREVVPEGKGGRTLEQQIESRMNSRIQKKLDQGYKRTPQEAEANSGTSTLDLPLPMLAQSKVGSLVDAPHLYAQPKLDGMRMIATKRDGKVVLYSRKGKLIETVPHIADELAHVLQEGMFIDGELYAHGTALQTIMSWAKRQQEDTFQLRFYAFDMIDDRPFSERFKTLANRVACAQEIRLVQTSKVQNESSIKLMFAAARNHGYEGLILRNGDAPYDINKRSKNLVKVKEFQDDEFMVLDVVRSKLGRVTLVCDGFTVTAPGTHNEQEWALENPEFFIGHKVTVQYALLTAKGIPFHPVCKGRRL